MALITNIDCVLPRPDIGELHAAMIAEFSKRLLGGAPVLPMSTEDVLAFIMSGAVNTMHGFVTQALKENNPATMCCDNLVRYASLHGIHLKAATRAKGYVALTGTPGALISSTMRFVGDSGREYKMDPGVTFNPTSIDTYGRAVVRTVANLGGTGFDQPVGTSLTVSTTFPGIDGVAIVIGGGIQGGTDEESCDSLRARVVAAEQAGVLSANLKWYLEQSSRYPGVTRVCADECEGCCDPQLITLYPFFESIYGDRDVAPYGVPPCEVLDAMNLWMFGKNAGKGEGLAPVGISGRYYAALPAFVGVTAYCFTSCPVGARDRMVAALKAHIRSRYCVGSKLCKEELRAVAFTAAGPDQCFSNVVIGVGDGKRREDASYIYLDCGHFPVLADVVLVEGPP